MITQENQLNKPSQDKNLGRIWPDYLQGKQIHKKELTFTKDLTLNLLLPLVELTDMTTCKLRLHRLFSLGFAKHKLHTYDFEIPLKGLDHPLLIL